MHPIIPFTGLLALLFAVVLFLLKRATLAQYMRANGVITGLIERPSHTDDRQEIKFTPRIAFRTAQGSDVDFVRCAAVFGRLQVGDTLPLLYDEKNPQQAVIDGFFTAASPSSWCFCSASLRSFHTRCTHLRADTPIQETT